MERTKRVRDFRKRWICGLGVVAAHVILKAVLGKVPTQFAPGIAAIYGGDSPPDLRSLSSPFICKGEGWVRVSESIGRIIFTSGLRTLLSRQSPVPQITWQALPQRLDIPLSRRFFRRRAQGAALQLRRRTLGRCALRRRQSLVGAG